LTQHAIFLSFTLKYLSIIYLRHEPDYHKNDFLCNGRLDLY